MTILNPDTLADSEHECEALYKLILSDHLTQTHLYQRAPTTKSNHKYPANNQLTFEVRLSESAQGYMGVAIPSKCATATTAARQCREFSTTFYAASQQGTAERQLLNL